MDRAAPDLGTCCICGTAEGVNVIVMLPLRANNPGHGWGCVVCGLPADGATAVLCDPCGDAYAHDEITLRFACAGYPGEDGRVPFTDLVVPFKHDLERHKAEL